MSTDDVYALIADILSLPGRYSLETVRAARDHVQDSFQKMDRAALQKVLDALESLMQRRTRERTKERARERVVIPTSDSDIALQEVAAILQDQEFLPTKAELAERLGELLGDAALRGTAKDSRDVLVRRALTVIGDLPPSRRSSIYKALRRQFFQKRGSTLGDWSDIISK